LTKRLLTSQLNGMVGLEWTPHSETELLLPFSFFITQKEPL